MSSITEDQYCIITINHTTSIEDWLTFSNPLPFQSEEVDFLKNTYVLVLHLCVILVHPRHIRKCLEM